MKRAVLTLISIFSCLPLLARQEITPPTFGTSAYAVSSPVVANNGTTFLTLWTVYTNLGGKHVYGSLADAKGSLQTPLSFLAIADASVQQLFASGSGYLAVVYAQGAQRTAAFSGDGKFLRFGAPLRSSKTFSNSLRTSNGSEFFKVGSNGYRSPAVETSAEVSGVDGSIIREFTPFAKAFLFEVAASDQNFFAATWENEGIFVYRFGRDGTQVSRFRVAPAPAGTLLNIAVAASGDDVAVAWSDRTVANDLVHLAVITPTGSVSGELQFGAPGFQLRGSATSFLLLTSSREVVRIDRSGKVVGSGPSAIAYPSNMAANDSVAYVVAIAGYPNRIVGGPVTADGNVMVSTPSVLSTMLRRQVWPVLASDGAGFLAAWSDQTAESKNLAAMRLDQNGAALDREQIDLGPSEPPQDDVSNYPFLSGPAHSVVFGRQVYLAIQQRGNDVLARRIDRFGTVLDQQPMFLSKAGISDHPAAWNGTAFFVTWSSGVRFGGVMVGEGGEVGHLLDLGAMGQRTSAPSVTWDGTRFLLSWIHYTGEVCGGCSRPDGVSLVRLSADGTRLDPEPGFFRAFSSLHRVATSGREFLVASDIYDYVNGEQQNRVELRTVRADGPTLQVSPPTRIFQWSQPITSDIAWSGRDYLLTLRYGMGTKHFLDLMHLSGDLVPTTRLSTEVAPDLYDRASAATNAAGETIIAIAEIATPGSSARIRTLSESEMTLQPPVPPAPLITSAVGTAQSAIVTWTQTPGTEVSGFLIESAHPFLSYNVTTLATTAAEARSATVSFKNDGGFFTGPLYVRMRAFNAAGLSAPTAPFHLILPLRNRR